jgi:hypothetical protein
MLLICLQNDVNDDDNNHHHGYDVFLTVNFMVFCKVNMKVKQLLIFAVVVNIKLYSSSSEHQAI